MTRSSYANGFHYSPDSTLHTTWTWRENNPTDKRNIAYAYSQDKGFTWKNNAGQIIARTAPGSDANVMGVNSPGLEVIPIARRHGLINQQPRRLTGRDAFTS